MKLGIILAIIATILTVVAFNLPSDNNAPIYTQSATTHTNYTRAWNELTTTPEFANTRANPDILELTHNQNRVIIALDARAFQQYSELERRSYVIGVTALGDRWRQITRDPDASVYTDMQSETDSR